MNYTDTCEWTDRQTNRQTRRHARRNTPSPSRESRVVCLFLTHSRHNFNIHRESKKQDTKLLPIKSPNVNRFSNFFPLADSVVNLQQNVFTHVNIPTRLKYVSTLPCKIYMFKKLSFTNKKIFTPAYKNPIIYCTQLL